MSILSNIAYFARRPVKSTDLARKFARAVINREPLLTKRGVEGYAKTAGLVAGFGAQALVIYGYAANWKNAGKTREAMALHGLTCVASRSVQVCVTRQVTKIVKSYLARNYCRH